MKLTRCSWGWVLTIVASVCLTFSVGAQSLVSGPWLEVFRWSPPVLPEGNPEVEHAGFRLYYYRVGSASTNVVTLDKSHLACVVSGLPAGRYYFFLTVVSADGLEGEASQTVLTRFL